MHLANTQGKIDLRTNIRTTLYKIVYVHANPLNTRERKRIYGEKLERKKTIDFFSVCVT